jgi:aspartate/methionine/tyrosine aminotransferase
MTSSIVADLKGFLAEGFLRFSYAAGEEHIEKAIERLPTFLAGLRHTRSHGGS